MWHRSHIKAFTTDSSLFSLINLARAVNYDIIIALMDEWSLLWNAHYWSFIQAQDLAPMTENISRRTAPPAGHKEHGIQKNEWQLLIQTRAATCNLFPKKCMWLYQIGFYFLLLKSWTNTTHFRTTNQTIIMLSLHRKFRSGENTEDYDVFNFMRLL